jgi:hypothetical protein
LLAVLLSWQKFPDFIMYGFYESLRFYPIKIRIYVNLSSHLISPEKRARIICKLQIVWIPGIVIRTRKYFHHSNICPAGWIVARMEQTGKTENGLRK